RPLNHSLSYAAGISQGTRHARKTRKNSPPCIARRFRAAVQEQTLRVLPIHCLSSNRNGLAPWGPTDLPVTLCFPPAAVKQTKPSLSAPAPRSLRYHCHRFACPLFSEGYKTLLP